MLHRLCGPPSIPLSFSLAAVLPRRGTYRVSYGTDGVDPPGTQCPSFTAWTTRVSNPVRSPRFRASASDHAQQAAFASGVLPDLYAFHRYTRNSACLYMSPAQQYPLPCTGLSPGLSQTDLPSRLRALYAQ
jgi:hypothetical protein